MLSLPLFLSLTPPIESIRRTIVEFSKSLNPAQQVINCVVILKSQKLEKILRNNVVCTKVMHTCGTGSRPSYTPHNGLHYVTNPSFLELWPRVAYSDCDIYLSSRSIIKSNSNTFLAVVISTPMHGWQRHRVDHVLHERQIKFCCRYTL